MRTIRHDQCAILILLAAGFTWPLAGCAEAGSPDDLPDAAVANRKVVNQGEPVDWPRWRGADQNGISPEGGWTTDWPEDGPTQLWRAQVGIGFSSMSIVGNRLYTMGHRPLPDADSDSAETKEDDTDKAPKKRGIDTVYCLHAETGEVVWRHEYSCHLVDNLHEGGPAATPTVYDGRVYTVSKEGHFFCLDAETGKVLWKRMFLDDLGVKMPGWGFSCSPLVDGQLVIVDGGRIAAYDRVTGDLVWMTDKFHPGYGSAVAFDFAEEGGQPERLITVLNNDSLLVLKKETGQEVARHDWTTSYQTSASTPTVAGDTIFISTGYKRGCLLVKFTGRELKKIYENKDLCNHMNNSVLWGGCWYGIHGNSSNSRNVTLSCLDFETGEVNWTQRGLGCGSLMIAGGKLICLSETGELVIVEPSSQEYLEIARTKVLDGKCWTVPVLAGGRIYARNASGDLVCLNVK